MGEEWKKKAWKLKILPIKRDIQLTLQQGELMEILKAAGEKKLEFLTYITALTLILPVSSW